MTQWNPNTMNATTMSTALDKFYALYNVVQNGYVDVGTWDRAHSAYLALVANLGQAGFHGASITYMNGGGSGTDANTMHTYLGNNGYPVDLSDVSDWIANGATPPAVQPGIMPAINKYGLPQCHTNTEVTLNATSSGLPTSGGGALPRRVQQPSGNVNPNFACHTCGPPPSENPSHGNFCFYANWAGAYLGFMSIPLSIEGAFFPPLGLAVGIIGLAVWVAAMVGGC